MTAKPDKKSYKIDTLGAGAEKWPIRPVFGNYVTENKGFVEYLKDISLQIETYISRESGRRPLNFLLAAPPGNGKSFLIKQLVSSISSPKRPTVFEEVYVGAFNNVDELYGVFQRVQTLNLQGKTPVVFFDEVDSKIGDIFVYQKFLAPMWDGEYYVGKDKHTLGNCIFFFAGSTLCAEEDSNLIVTTSRNSGDSLPYERYYSSWESAFLDGIARQNEESANKVRDFIDRIDCILRIPPIDEVFLGKDVEKEYYDLLFMLIMKHFPEIKYVGKKIMKLLFEKVKKGNSIRGVEKLIFSSSPQDGEIFDLNSLTPRCRRMLLGHASAGRPEKHYEPVIERR